MRALLILAGLGNFGLALGSLAIPSVLNWTRDLEKLRPLMRQIFRTYSVYIWATNLSFGLLSFFRPDWLLDGSPLARAVAGYIAVYWGARVLIQFFYYDRTERPQGFHWLMAEWSLVLLFIYLTGVYGHIAVTGG